MTYQAGSPGMAWHYAWAWADMGWADKSRPAWQAGDLSCSLCGTWHGRKGGRRKLENCGRKSGRQTFQHHVLCSLANEKTWNCRQRNSDSQAGGLWRKVEGRLLWLRRSLPATRQLLLPAFPRPADYHIVEAGGGVVVVWWACSLRETFTFLPLPAHALYACLPYARQKGRRA